MPIGCLILLNGLCAVHLDDSDNDIDMEEHKKRMIYVSTVKQASPVSLRVLSVK